MANPIHFKPPPVDPRAALNHRLEAAPTEHAEAMLVLWDLLQSAHDQGLLDTAHGLVQAKDTVFGALADYAKLPESIAATRNVISLAKIVGSLPPEGLETVAKALVEAAQQHAAEVRPPGMWHILRRITGEEGRRGLSFVAWMLTGLGRAMGPAPASEKALPAPQVSEQRRRR